MIKINRMANNNSDTSESELVSYCPHDVVPPLMTAAARKMSANEQNSCDQVFYVTFK